MNLETFSIILWDVVEPTAFAVIGYLVYKMYTELRTLNEYLHQKEMREPR